MRRSRFAPAMMALAAALALAPAARAQQEPPLFQETPAQPAPSPAPAPSPGLAPAPAAAAPEAPLAVPLKPLGATLDYARWKEMNSRERQTFVEGSILSLASVAGHLRGDLALDGRTPPETLAAIVKFVDLNNPRHAPSVYLREMESIYLTADGQKLSIFDCFLQAFRRVNGK